MANPVNMPPLGESVTEGTVTRWLKQVGDRVEQDEPLVEIATDKVDTEIPSPVAGTLLEITVPEDETAEVGAQLAVIGEESEAGSGGGDAGGAPDDAATPEVREEERQDSGSEAPSSEDSVPVEQADVPAEAPSPDADAPAAKPTADTQHGGGGTEIVMPALGESVTEGTITRWLKAEGDTVEVDEPIVEVATDKVDTEIPSPVAGTVLRILVQEDETAEVGAPLVVVGDPSASGGSQDTPAQDPAPAEEPTQAPAADVEDAAAEQPPTTGTPQGSPEPLQDARSGQQPPEASGEHAGDTAEDSSAGQYNSPEAQVPQPTALDTTPTTQDSEQGSGAQPSGQGSGMSAVSTGGDASGYITPIVRKLAGEKGVDLSTVTGTGVGGRIRRQDVLAAAEAAEKASRAAAETPAPVEAPAPAAAAPAAAPAAQAAPASVDPRRGTREKMSRLRKVIAQRMVESLQVSAQRTTVVEVDVTRVAALRTRAKNSFAQREGVRLSFLPFFALAAVEALKAYPVVNSSVEGDEIVYHGGEHLGIAVDTERGLLVPVIKDAGDLNIAGLARKIADLAERTRTNKATPDELSGGTFTLTNTGSRGALFDTPILNQPQVAILGTGSVVKRPMVLTDAEGNESIAVRSMVYLALSYDHRVVDGADAARFLSTVKARLEEGAFESALGL
ncbi:2-oxoglutarate dehydrogenase, E2 component, dihydrolipoamide succinyltransferase [Aquipuribacter hungaricus]|uniref:2-oxoglutarate dehydrogenase, E2 component, dihydrolipoamide succinyltransferase n=1 Tax=Aquipuribacter hungaricus TaxID=545624 RepID=UPI003613C6C4